MAALKEALVGKLSKKELEKLIASYDVTGSIAIIEIPDELEKKENIIGNTLLTINPQIKTVLKKEGIHKGKFRRQKLKVLAGERTKTAEYKENGVVLKLDVEKVYFSPRLSTERKRVFQQVKENEDILVMFSGCAPYPVIISKNTKARMVYGIELNPIAHRFGIENIKLNKLKNVELVLGDVKEVASGFYQSIIGLKSANINGQIEKRLEKSPKIFEFHTFAGDFGKGFSSLKKRIEELKKKDVQIFVHQPFEGDGGNKIDLVRCDASHAIYKKMVWLSEKYGVSLVIHVSNLPENFDLNSAIANARTFRKHYKSIYFENGFTGGFNTEQEFLKFISSAGITNFCVDISHMLCKYSVSQCASIIRKIQELCSTYFHVNDNKSMIDSMPLDESSIKMLDSLLPLVQKGVVEVRSKDEASGSEMISSWGFLSKFKRSFDRIIMPLPKDAGSFLDSAMLLSKKGTIIHLYTFSHEDKFKEEEEKAVSKIRELGRECEILGIFKCGNYSPRVFRICIDIEII